ncbi:MAG TPA: hypothetical protein VMQ76_11810 [Terracidiphilus sp.]|nr:hypothetical protein [Terracidiphilus sp.]
MDPASHINYHAMRYHELAEHPEIRAEAIANHYTRNIQAAITLKKAIELRRQMRPDDELPREVSVDLLSGLPIPRKEVQTPSECADACITYLAAQLIRAHLTDFGLPLEWTARAPEKNAHD